MKINLEKMPAYQGKGWKARKQTLSQELKTQKVYSNFRTNSEYADLKTVVLYCPQTELKKIRSPRSVQHLFPIVLTKIQRQFRALKQAYKKIGVRVIEIDPSHLPKALRTPPPNLMFCRDLFFNSMEGAVVSRMSSRVRAGEEKFAAATLSHEGALIRASIGGRGLFEGSADAQWITAKLLAVAVGNRTNREGFNQIRALMKTQGVKCVPVQMPRGVQHLMGMLQIVDRNLALVRTSKAPKSLVRLLRAQKFRVVPVRESVEVTLKMGFNFVTVKPRTIITSAGCPELKALYESEGIKIAAEVDVSQICNAAGGIGCATGILSRKVV